MKATYIFLFLFPLINSLVVNIPPNKELNTETDSQQTFTFYFSLDNLPVDSSGVINLFTTEHFALNPLYKKFAQSENGAKSVKDSEDEHDKIRIESFANGARFRILFKKTEKKQHFITVTFRKDKDTKIYIPEPKLFTHKETSVHDIIEKTHKIKGNNPIYFYIHLPSLKDYIEYEITQSGNSQITFFTENKELAPSNIYHIDENIDTFNLYELINMQEDDMIMEIYNEHDVSESFIAKHTAFEYYETLDWENQGLLIVTHQIIPKNKDDIHKFILNKDSITKKTSERYFVNIIHLSGTYNIDYNIYGSKNITEIKYDKKIHRGNNLISVSGDNTYVFKIICLSKVCLLNFQLIKTNTDKINQFKFGYYTKYFYLYVENKRTFELDVENDYLSALNSGNYKLYMTDSKGNPKVVENKHKINEFVPLVGKKIEVVVNKPTLFLLYHNIKEEKSPYDDLSKFKDVIGFRYHFNSIEEHDVVSAYLFKQPFNVKDFNYSPHQNKFIGKLIHFKKQYNFDFFNPYLHYDSDIDKYKFALSTCRFEKNLLEENIDLLFYTNKTSTLKLREFNEVNLVKNNKTKFLLPLDHDIRNDTIEDYNLVIIIDQDEKINGVVNYSIADYIDYHYNAFEKEEKLLFDKNGKSIIIISDINLAKGIRFVSDSDIKLIVYYTYVKKDELYLVNNNKFVINFENKLEKEIELSISPFVKSVNISSEYNVYRTELNNLTNVYKVIKEQPITSFYDANLKNDKITFKVPVDVTKKYLIIIVAHSLDKSQLDKGIYYLEYDPNKIPINVNLLICVGACVFLIILFYCCCCGKKKEENEKEKGQELDDLDEYKKV